VLAVAARPSSAAVALGAVVASRAKLCALKSGRCVFSSARDVPGVCLPRWNLCVREKVASGFAVLRRSDDETDAARCPRNEAQFYLRNVLHGNEWHFALLFLSAALLREVCKISTRFSSLWLLREKFSRKIGGAGAGRDSREGGSMRRLIQCSSCADRLHGIHHSQGTLEFLAFEDLHFGREPMRDATKRTSYEGMADHSSRDLNGQRPALHFRGCEHEGFSQAGRGQKSLPRASANFARASCRFASARFCARAVTERSRGASATP
jgi:hypothetical protein